jgi:hypothetical protein
VVGALVRVAWVGSRASIRLHSKKETDNNKALSTPHQSPAFTFDGAKGAGGCSAGRSVWVSVGA